jgi:hypothetical protein
MSKDNLIGFPGGGEILAQVVKTRTLSRRQPVTLQMDARGNET